MVIVREVIDKMDNDLISRKAVLSLPRNTTRNFFGEIVEESIDVADIEALPSAQPEIIRCKDCMHNGSFDTDCPIDWNGKEYCSFAERKEDE